MFTAKKRIINSPRPHQRHDSSDLTMPEIQQHIQIIADVLLVVHRNYVIIVYRFRDITVYWPKICHFFAVLPMHPNLI